MRRRVNVVVSICPLSNLTSGASVRPENTVTYSADNGDKKICGFFSETASLRRSVFPVLKAIRTVGHFFLRKARMRIIVPRAINVATSVLHFSAFEFIVPVLYSPLFRKVFACILDYSIL